MASYEGLLGAVQSVGARMTVYVARYVNLLASPAATWEATGHDLSVHPVFAEDGVSGNFAQGYTTGFNWFATNVPPPVTPGPTVRHHTLEWAGWVDAGDRDGQPSASGWTFPTRPSVRPCT